MTKTFNEEENLMVTNECKYKTPKYVSLTFSETYNSVVVMCYPRSLIIKKL